MKVAITSIATKKITYLSENRDYESFHVEEVINALIAAKINGHGGN